MLDIRPADLLAIAGCEIPTELLPANPDGISQVMTVADYAWGSDPVVLDYARSLPIPPRTTGTTGLPAMEAMTFGDAFRRLMQVRNLRRRAMAHATFLSEPTVGVVINDYRMPEPRYLRRMAAMLCLRSDDFLAMAASMPAPHPLGSPGQNDPPSDFASLWTRGELILALAPLHAEQIDAVIAFRMGLPEVRGKYGRLRG
ncbi:helix-turn-helix transcriptional regulator [Dactylosporangium aurantiacum]|uniref:Helix-turn-helix transcriptional regulator n=1 Tax=Dactylosporangium aurantiacum TaxID=35754 RepID=A0A9Q9MFR4_9ACTN|nr:helix-turn-helix transcriptional regulator [Dactylosporangium aurantiacum]MDG6101239.1 helix-turn-helix transcriptional regulator [Dactylosporangium aurantiacum]UWZ54744.1 helix-turn-helix transcriptional regulator [Dactylosporangium aurantiacum]